MSLKPQAKIDEATLTKGLRHLMWDAAFATAVGTLNSGVVLVALALHLGASNAYVGLLAAVPFLSQLIQAPAVVLVEKVRTRKLISVACLFFGRLALPIMGLMAVLPNREVGLGLLLISEMLHCAFNGVAACSWNSWIRDLVPEDRLGRFFARRTVYATAIGLIGSLAAGLALEWAEARGPGAGWAFTALYLTGFVSGLISTWQLSQVPEPAMPPVGEGLNMRRLLRMPLRDDNFRRLMVFLSSWQFAVNLATPFFAVYLLRQLGFGMAFVMTLSVVSQIANLVVLRSWGRLSDRFSNKTVLSVAAPLFIASIAAMVVASQITWRPGLIAYLVALHAFMGMASAGVGLASNAVALKLAPRGAGTAYIATNSLVTAVAAGVAPALGGVFADFFSARALEFSLRWIDPAGAIEIAGLRLSHWDFYFLLAALFGLYALHRLTLIREEGETQQRELVEQVMTQARRNIRALSTVAGLKLSAAFPAGALMEFHRERLARREQRRAALRNSRSGEPVI